MSRVIRVAAVLAFGAVSLVARADEPAACGQVEMTSIASADMPPSVWASLPGWSAKLKFRIDADGSAVDSVVTLLTRQRGADADEATLRQVAIDTMNRFRFCVPENHKARANWVATLRFTPVAERGLYVQSFEPAYTQDEIRERRVGTVRVLVVFDVDGHVDRAEVRRSSGDDALDRKAVRAVMSDRVVVAGGLPLSKPLSIEQPFTFQIQ